MPTISFQGVCLFHRDSPSKGEVTVRLPVADRHERHLDEVSAQPHHARIYVREKVLIDQKGFLPCRYHPVDANGQHLPVERGLYFPLTRLVRELPYTILVSDQGSNPLNVGDLAQLPSISGVYDLGEPTDDLLAASLEIRNGTLSFGAGKTHTWQISQLQPQPTDRSLGTGVWRIDWDVGTAPEAPVTITVRDGWYDEVASVTIDGAAGPCDVIIGNLDVANPASWPRRKPLRAEDCEDSTGKSGSTCHDNDFKWLYRLYDPDKVEELMAAASDGKLPVPHLAHSLLAEGTAHPMLDTPTCFPGTD